MCGLGDLYDKEIIKLTTIQEKMNENVIEKNELKYCSVRSQFAELGLKIPPAFEKPTDESLKKCWLFYEWKSSTCDNLMSTKRNIIDMCNLLMDNIVGNVVTFLSMQRKYNDEDSKITPEKIKQYLNDIIRCVTDCPEIKTLENIRVYATDIVRVTVSLWESVGEPKVKKEDICSYYKYSYFAVMKLTRNWMVHQGIKEVDIQFAAFVFLISVKGIFFDLKKFETSVRDEYRKHEKGLIKNLTKKPIILQNILQEKNSKTCMMICLENLRNLNVQIVTIMGRKTLLDIHHHVDTHLATFEKAFQQLNCIEFFCCVYIMETRIVKLLI